MFNFNFFKSAPAESQAQSQEGTWNPNTIAMQQPSSPAAPSADGNVVAQQPVCGPETLIPPTFLTRIAQGIPS